MEFEWGRSALDNFRRAAQAHMIRWLEMNGNICSRITSDVDSSEQERERIPEADGSCWQKRIMELRLARLKWRVSCSNMNAFLVKVNKPSRKNNKSRWLRMKVNEKCQHTACQLMPRVGSEGTVHTCYATLLAFKKFRNFKSHSHPLIEVKCSSPTIIWWTCKPWRWFTWL